MTMQVIRASELARKTSEILERVVMGESVRVMRNRTEVAHLVPARRTMTCQQAIAGLVGQLPPGEGEAWLRESRGDFDEGIRNPWE